MPLNLIENPWIPVLCANGARRVIAPWQMAEPGILRPDWPRPDLNVACYEFLIGLVFLADPPANNGEWQRRVSPDPQRLRDRLAPLAPAFNLLGAGPRFLQDLENLAGPANPVDMLFIDSAGANAEKNNADLIVHRGRYPRIDLPLAAMTLYAFQAHAPAGGAGNRTSMRGGGPLVTLVDPGGGLWPLIWANTPCGAPGKPDDLPWMRPTRLSDAGQQTLPPEGRVFGAEAFFGMPRRLRLIGDDEGVTGVIQKPWGTNYALWKHPLSPYYRMKPGQEWLPKHPRAGHFGYRNWLGIVAQEVGSETSERSLSLRDWAERGGEATVIVAGWAMDNMKPRDFTLSVQPLLTLSDEARDWLAGMILAAEAAGVALCEALEPVLAKGEAREAEREAFFALTEDRFLRHVQALKSGGDPRDAWLADLRGQALRQFDALTEPGLDQRETERIEQFVEARKKLAGAFAGFDKRGRDIFTHLGMEPPAAKRRKRHER
ncbi:type I-E CRISPR-associated protein Cse1/CasA [Rhodovulum sp.]|uniref:type I-E CRISPR-associated protein Cse1/CasA n=1 Tax=Rhodovulum sp. TaxID=34009 RepID=UPI001834909B|nr:type I-E CRISPR-associated protein Cse1/CasA [Rhodovulum sp.]HDR27091.1 type I-E CRISPR-associated protein Cse1/CasA [Rhodovulum sp.]